MKTFQYGSEIKRMRAGWQHASQDEQNARVPGQKNRTHNSTRKGSASMLLAEAVMLPACTAPSTQIATQRTTTISPVEQVGVRGWPSLRHPSFVVGPFAFGVCSGF